MEQQVKLPDDHALHSIARVLETPRSSADQYEAQYSEMSAQGCTGTQFSGRVGVKKKD